jgi:transcriptional regulator with XRE-family HTH domain
MPLSGEWHLFFKFSSQLVIFAKQTSQGMLYAPLFMVRFPFLQPRNVTEAGRFNLSFRNPSLLSSTADKLRYYRYKRALLQSDVAIYAGIDPGTYSSYEEGIRDYYPPDKLSKIAEFLNVDLKDLLDEYNFFLFCGQGKAIKKLRQELRMTQSEFAAHLGVHLWNIKQWEKNKVRVSKKTWKKLFACRQSNG